MRGGAHLDSQCVSPMIDDPISHPVMDFPPLVTLAGRTFFVEHGETLRTHAAETIQAEALVDLTAARDPRPGAQAATRRSTQAAGSAWECRRWPG